VIAGIAHGDRVEGHLCFVLGVGEDGVVESGAPAAVVRVDTRGASDVELCGGGLDFFDGGYWVDALGSF
jgi:hypothetical protein